MVEVIPSPEPHRLIPPLLASIPTAFASRRPPPALLDLVSPILRQRLQHLSAVSTSPCESWLELLCWDKAKAVRLRDVVESGLYEPHPSSGEVEVGDIGMTEFKRLDRETLHVRIGLSDWQLCALYLWCGEDEGRDSWKLAELQPYDDDLADDPTWTRSIREANQGFGRSGVSEVLPPDARPESQVSTQDTEDDNYWARYDKAAGQTPEQNSPSATASDPIGERSDGSENDHYARYSEVQPAMDNHNPSEESANEVNSSVHAEVSKSMMRPRSELAEGRSMTSHEDSVAAVALGSADRHSNHEEQIRPHIKDTIKTLYSLARSTGIQAEEFIEMARREVNANDQFGPELRPGC